MASTLSILDPFYEAMKSLAQRQLLPTSLGSDELQQLGGAFHRQNFTSAKTAAADLLDRYKEGIGSILNPTTEQRADRITPENPSGNVTTGLDPATVRAQVKKMLGSDGKGGITDLGSDARINLVIKTNVELSQGAGFAVQSNDPAVLEAFPCWELYRLEARKVERNWPQRWRIAAAVAGDVDAARVLEETGRMVARKDSPIWDALGNAEDDSLGNPYPPFAFNSGMWTRNVSFAEAEALGLVDLNTKVESSLPDDLAELFKEAA